jgi:ABC-type branched-subunit amino acid transport system ATPase component
MSQAATTPATPDTPGAGLPVLRTTDLSVTYANGAVGTDKVSFSVPQGTIAAILGRNGAGKTSLLRAIAGFLRSEHVAVSGGIEFAGRQVAGASPMKMHRQGVVFVPEREKVFPGLKVADHLRLVSSGRGAPEPGLSFEPVDRRMTSRAGMLSGGERQMLALTMAVRQSPRLLLVDELSLGLAPVIVKDLMAALRRLTDSSGVPIVMVEQDAAAALRIADQAYVMDRGQIVWQGRSAETDAAEISARYLGVTR